MEGQDGFRDILDSMGLPISGGFMAPGRLVVMGPLIGCTLVLSLYFEGLGTDFETAFRLRT